MNTKNRRGSRDTKVTGDKLRRRDKLDNAAKVHRNQWTVGEAKMAELNAETEALESELQLREAQERIDRINSYHSYISDEGTRYSENESFSDDHTAQRANELLGESGMNKKRYGKKKRKESCDSEISRRPSWLPSTVPGTDVQEDLPRSFSVHSEVSEGGTRRRFKRKVLRDDDGNVIGYGSPEPYLSSGESDGESIRLRRGSFSEDDESIAQGKKTLKRLQRMIERPKRRQQQQQDDDSEKTWVEEVLDGLPLKLRNSQKKTMQADDNALDLPLLDMPKASARTHRKSTLPDIEEDEYFSESSDEDVDLSAMSEEERRLYLEAKEKRREERERRMREKFGDKYEEMKRKRREQKEAEARAKAEAAAAEAASMPASVATAGDDGDGGKGRRQSGARRDYSTLQSRLRQKPQSMVSYEKGPARELGGTIDKTDARDIGPSHKDWTRRPSRTKDLPKKKRDDGFPFDFKPSKMPPIKLAIGGENGEKQQAKPKELDVSFAESPDGVFEEDIPPKNEPGNNDLGVFEVGDDGQLKVKDGEEIDLNRISSAVLRKLGIDPKLSKTEIVRRLKEKLGNNVVIKDGVFSLGTKPISAYDLDKVTDEMLAEDPELDINTLKGLRRVNVLMRKGGEKLLAHVRHVIDGCRHSQAQDYAKNLDETDSSIDFLSHYRLVDPGKLEGYARAFAVEDRDLDTVINFLETQTALDGISSIQHMTSKQMDYVLKILDIDDASQVTFRMFAVITALCERVTQMDPLSKHLLEICNLADIERKLDLYKSMFYHNAQSDRRSNFITAESLKIELIAGGLSWKQQEYVMDKMEANSWGEISFLDYMCYIPLFMSMHDNICDNPLDMSDEKYVMPPRQRPPSPQRDMNPLGHSLSKFSVYLLKKQARDLNEGRLDPSVVREDQLKLLRSYAKLPDIDTFDKPIYDEDDDTIDLIY